MSFLLLTLIFIYGALSVLAQSQGTKGTHIVYVTVTQTHTAQPTPGESLPEPETRYLSHDKILDTEDLATGKGEIVLGFDVNLLGSVWMEPPVHPVPPANSDHAEDLSDQNSAPEFTTNDGTLHEENLQPPEPQSPAVNSGANHDASPPTPAANLDIPVANEKVENMPTPTSAPSDAVATPENEEGITSEDPPATGAVGRVDEKQGELKKDGDAEKYRNKPEILEPADSASRLVSSRIGPIQTGTSTAGRNEFGFTFHRSRGPIRPGKFTIPRSAAAKSAFQVALVVPVVVLLLL